MSLFNIIFYFFAAAAALSALSLVLVKNVFYGALLLITCLLSVAGLYVLSFAEFVAVTQIMVYAGGVLVLIIFGIMLTTRLGEKPLLVEHANVFSGALVGLSLFVILVIVVKIPLSLATKPMGSGSIEKIGVSLMTDHLIAFEVAGLLLLAALIGAAVIASNKSKQT
jgi:NADH:ubiquinone oxidoreductase subunit 6 (subunit J)